MKKLLPFSTLLALVFTGLTAQDNSFFTIQVGTFIDAKAEDFKPLQAVGLVYARDVGGNLREVFVGGYDSREAAERGAAEVRQKGYANAFIQERRAADGRAAVVIQMATRKMDSKLEWEKFMEAGEIYGTPSGNLIKIAAGPYASTDAAQKDLPRVRKLGFKDAFVKTANSVHLIPLTEFETGVKKPLIPLGIGQAAPKTASGQPSAYEVLTPRTPDVAAAASQPSVPSSYEYYAGVPATASTASQAALPAINSRIKRNSVMELQKILKSANAYTGGLDGYYGSGTASGYEAFIQQNRTIRKYQLLAENMPAPGQEKANAALQSAIDALASNPSAGSRLDAFNEPVARGYRAYEIFSAMGASPDVNRMMNAAIRDAFASQGASGLPFDPFATYAYQDIGQLVLHLYYIHCASGTNVSAPCWLATRHPQEAARAYQACAGLPGAAAKLQACSQFENWPEIKVLVAIASDLNADQSFNQQRLSQAAAERARLYAAPTPLNQAEEKAVEGWSRNLMAGLNSWATRDPLNQQINTAFQAMFYQSQARLEDFFMSKGYDANQARGLSLATLHTLVAYHLQRFV